MVATPVTPHQIVRAGVAPTAEAAADNTNGNVVPNDGSTWLEVTNGGGSSATVAVAFTQTVDGQAVTPVSHTIAAAGKLRLGPFPVGDYGPVLHFTASAATVTVVAYTLGL